MGIQATNHPTSPLNRMSPYLKRKHDPACLDFIEANEMVEPKKICIELVCAAAAAAATTTTTTPMTTSSEPSSTQNGHKEENKENEMSLKETSAASTSTTSAPSPTTTMTIPAAAAPTMTTMTTTPGGAQVTSKTAETLLMSKLERREVDNPKVIVEHQPLPSIYDLRQMTCDDAYDDSGLSDDDSSEEESSECDDDDEDDVRPSPIFEPVLRGTGMAKPIMTPSPPTAKAIYNSNDRFWSQNSFSMNAPTPPPPGSPLPPSATPVTMNGNATFHFLENNNQRIECAENGKSYLQLGTMSHHHHHHHHLPVTPVIQPKPVLASAAVERRHRVVEQRGGGPAATTTAAALPWISERNGLGLRSRGFLRFVELCCQRISLRHDGWPAQQQWQLARSHRYLRNHPEGLQQRLQVHSLLQSGPSGHGGRLWPRRRRRGPGHQLGLGVEPLESIRA